MASDHIEGLRCPKCNSKVEMMDDKSGVQCINGDCALIYPIRDGAPVMQVSDARVDN